MNMRITLCVLAVVALLMGCGANKGMETNEQMLNNPRDVAPTSSSNQGKETNEQLRILGDLLDKDFASMSLDEIQDFICSYTDPADPVAELIIIKKMKQRLRSVSIDCLHNNPFLYRLKVNEILDEWRSTYSYSYPNTITDAERKHKRKTLQDFILTKIKRTFLFEEISNRLISDNLSNASFLSLLPAYYEAEQDKDKLIGMVRIAAYYHLYNKNFSFAGLCVNFLSRRCKPESEIKIWVMAYNQCNTFKRKYYYAQLLYNLTCRDERVFYVLCDFVSREPTKEDFAVWKYDAVDAVPEVKDDVLMADEACSLTKNDMYGRFLEQFCQYWPGVGVDASSDDIQKAVSQAVKANLPYLYWDDATQTMKLDSDAKAASIPFKKWNSIEKELREQWESLSESKRRGALLRSAIKIETERQSRIKSQKAIIPFHIWRQIDEDMRSKRWRRFYTDEQLGAYNKALERIAKSKAGIQKSEPKREKEIGDTKPQSKPAEKQPVPPAPKKKAG